MRRGHCHSLVSSSSPIAEAINDEEDGSGIQKGIILTLLSDRGAIIYGDLIGISKEKKKTNERVIKPLLF